MDKLNSKEEQSTGVKLPVMPCSIKYEDLDRCFSTLFDLAEREINRFDRKEYINYVIMINETIFLEGNLNKA